MGRNSKRMKIDGRTYRVTLDKFLADKQLRRKSIAKDGSCLFRAVSEQVYGSQCYHQKVRLKCIEYIGAHGDDFKEFITVPLDKYLALLSKELWGGEVELVVLSRLYNRSIVVYNELSERREVQEQVFPSVEDYQSGLTIDKLTNPILLAYSDRNHYDSVFSTQFLEDTAFCQGLLYTMLMEKVFKQHVPFNCRRRLSHLQESDINTIVKYTPGQERHNQSDPRVYSTLGRYGVDLVRAMSWTLHHNAALSLHRWEKDGVEQRDRHMAASIQFHVGNRCYFHINGKRMSGEIASLNIKPGFHSVRVHQSQKERWEIPVKDISLSSSHSTASGKQGKPLPSGEQSMQTNPRSTPGSGGRENRSSRQHKDQSSPTTEASSSSHSILGPPPVTVSSPTPTKRGKATAQSQQTERTQKANSNYTKHRTGNSGPVTPTDTAPRQEHNRTKPGTTAKSPKTDHVGTMSPAVPGAGLPGTATGSLQLNTPTNPTKMAPYSSVVKKTAGGPSGSLTSEGTEYDESSDEAAQDESKEVQVSESSKFPAPHQSQQQREAVESNKPLSMGRSRGHAATTADDNVARENKSTFTVDISKQSNAHDAPPTMIPQHQQDSPYLDPQIPRAASSQPQDAWPEVPQASIPPQNTMIYAAVMTNRSNQDLEPPIDTQTRFPYSATATVKANTFSPQHTVASRVANPPLTLPPQTASGVHLPQAQPQPSNHTVLGPGLNYHLPAGHHHTAHPQFQTGNLPAATSLAYGVMTHGMNLGNRTGADTTNMIPRASSSPQVGGYNRSPRMMNETATNRLPPQYYAISTQAAAMEVRNMLGIEGRQSANQPVYVGSSNFKTVVSTSLPHHKTTPITKDSAAQTVQPATSVKEVQVGVEAITQGVQTVAPLKSNSETQTDGFFVPSEDLAPAQDVQMESVADRLLFAVRYSLQCLSVLSQTTGDQSSEMEAALEELLDSEQIEQLVDQAARSHSLTASQQNFLRSVGTPGDMPYHQGSYGDSQPLTPQSAEFGGRNEDVTPQQEQHHLPAPGMPRMNMPPTFPFMIPPHPFMMPPHRMFYPVMTPMPVPPPMGYAPLVPSMLPHQVAPPPPLSPGPDVRLGGGVTPPHLTPDNAHHDFPVQDQLQQDDAEVDGEPPQQFPPQQFPPQQYPPQQYPPPQYPPPQYLPQQLPPQAQPAQSSEMVASSVYPIPPSAMVQANAPPTQPTPGVVSADVPEDQVDSIHPQQQDCTVQQDDMRPDHTSPTVASDRNSPSAEEAFPTEVKVAPPLQKQPLHSATQAAPSQPKSQRSSRKSLQPNANSGQEPGLPCRSTSSSVQGGGYQHPSKSGWRQSGKGKGQGRETQRRATTKSKTGGTHNFNNRKVEQEEESSPGASEGGKKEASSKKDFHSSRARHAQDHTGSPAVSGPSNASNKSNQDPTRNFAPAFGRTMSRSSSTSGGVLDTKDFKWGVPSPGPDIVLDSSAPANHSTSCQPDAKSEWPDMSELGVSRNCQQQTFSSSLKFTSSRLTPQHYPNEQFAEVDGSWDGPYAETDSIEDPFPAVSAVPVAGVWQSDIGDYPLTLSPSQAQSNRLAQCTGDLNKPDQRVANLHKH